MIALVLVATALAAPPGYRVTKEDVSGCTLMLGPSADGVTPMRAECHWPDVPFDRFTERFARWEDHDQFFGTVAESDVLSTSGGTTVFRQVHVSKGISDREVALDGTVTTTGDTVRYAWTKSAHQLTVPKGRVEAARSDGYWEVTRAADGGVDVTHELAYDPGGSVPMFLVKWFQTSGLSAIVTDLHTHMSAP